MCNAAVGWKFVNIVADPPAQMIRDQLPGGWSNDLHIDLLGVLRLGGRLSNNKRVQDNSDRPSVNTSSNNTSGAI
jgi:hypothetical protein